MFSDIQYSQNSESCVFQWKPKLEIKPHSNHNTANSITEKPTNGYELFNPTKRPHTPKTILASQTKPQIDSTTSNRCKPDLNNKLRRNPFSCILNTQWIRTSLVVVGVNLKKVTFPPLTAAHLPSPVRVIIFSPSSTASPNNHNLVYSYFKQQHTLLLAIER